MNAKLCPFTVRSKITDKQ